jgi:glycolate oxidase iron-sulfur subunit
LEATRAALHRTRSLPLATRALHGVIAAPNLRRVVFGAARLLRPVSHRFAGASRIGVAWGMLAATRPVARPPAPGRATPHRNPADTPRAHVALFHGCVMDDLFSHVHAATARVLLANGYRLVDIASQGCCGALHVHAGQREEALALARLNIVAFESLPDDTLLAVNAAGCGAMLKELGHLFQGEGDEAKAMQLASRARDVTEILAEAGPRHGAPLHLRVAYDPPCHLLHAQRVADAPRKILDAVPGITQVAHADADQCCGSAGSYTFAQPEMSSAVLTAKSRAIADVAPDVVVTGNPGCIMQIGAGLRAAGLDIPVIHPIELLDWSYEHAGYYRG